MRRPARLVLAVLLLSVALHGQDKPRQDTFTERVEVKVRTIVAIVTDAGGKHLASAPSAGDLEVLENGAPAEIVGIERLPRAGTEARTADTSRPAPADSRSAPSASAAQVLYIDPNFIYRGSASLYSKTLMASVEALAARGPLRIVVAGSTPKDLLDSTSDPAVVKAALKKLPAEADGTASLFESRRRLMDSPSVGDWQMIARVFIARDIERIETSLQNLALWAAANHPATPTILYLVSDGFELDPTDFYLNCRKFCPPSAVHERERFRNTFAQRVPRAASQVAADLVSLGFTVVPVTNGTPPVFKVEGAIDQPQYSMRRSIAAAVRSGPATPIALAWQPTDPLYKVAEATGGEVAVGESKLRKALDRFDDAYAVAYKSRAAGQPGVLSLEIRPKRPGLLVRAANSTAGGASSSEILARGRAAAALRDGGSGGSLAVSVRMEPGPSGKPGLSAGTLMVATDFAPAIEALARVGPPRARVTLAVETDDPVPFLTTRETDVDNSGAGTVWTFELPMTWPRQARRVSVLVEEVKTGLFGLASTDLRATQ